jgi:hypothetical protein
LYLEGKLTNEDLLWLTNPSTVRIIELNGDMQLGKVEEIATTALPQAMLPTNEGGFEHGSCPDLSRIREILAEYPAMALATA